MKRFLRGMAFALSCLYICTYAMAGYAAPNVDCTPFTQSGPTDSTPYSQGCGSTQSWELTTLYKTEIRTIKWPDGHTENNVRASSTGACVLIHPKCHTDIMNKFFGGVGLQLLLRDAVSPIGIIKIYMAKTGARGARMLTQRILKEIIAVVAVEPGENSVHFASRVLNALDATTNPTVLWAIAKPIRP